MCILAIFLTGCTQTTTQIDNVTSIGKAGTHLLIQQGNTVSMYDYKLHKKESVPAQGFMWASVSHEENIFIGYGYSREFPTNPLIIMKYDLSLKNPEIVYTSNTTRSQITTLKSTSKGVLLTYFTSKYDTKTLVLETMEIVDQRRMGMYTDYHEGLLVGRPYGNDIGIDGDVTYNNAHIPSFRGVNALTFIDINNDGEKEIIIADGWHQNYGQLAEPRLSIFNGSYVTIDTQYPQHSIRKIEQIGEYIFTVGNLQASLYTMQNWERKIIAEIEDRFILFDVVHIVDGYFAILKNQTVTVIYEDI